MNAPAPGPGEASAGRPAPLATAEVATLRGAGPRTAARLAALGVHTVQDLLFLLPHRYEDRTCITPIGGARPGHTALVAGKVDLAQVQLGRRRTLLVALSDGTGSLLLRFFHFSAAQRERLAPGRRLSCYGEVRQGPRGPEMVHPEYVLLAPDEPPPLSPHLTPVYPTTEGLGQATLRRLVDGAMDRLDGGGGLEELLPARVRERMALPTLEEALRAAHRPPVGTQGPGEATRRLAFEELLAHHLSLMRLRERARAHRAPTMRARGALGRRLVDTLPFALTAAQERVVDEILGDLRNPHPMHRLLQGDVGSGKTLVAALAALHAVEAGHQVALMAPTELLAEQHRASFEAWLPALGVRCGWVTGRMGARARADALGAVADGRTRMVVGTHALFQDDVTFRELGLVIVDEQHRFGVHQRLSLRDKGSGGSLRPHQLVMTATPIPRTLAMAAYADLDTSVIDQMPPGRTPVETVAVSQGRRHEVVARVHRAVQAGEQTYWVCTLVEESEILEARAAEDSARRLAEAMPDVRIGLVHGRMKGPEKHAAMAAFKSGETRVLVATTVVEVGVDVPAASLMIIENAERLGLAQLHQLRGRVGRGGRRSVCVLLYQPPLGAPARGRIDAMRATADGFAIAQRDLELRGPGEVLGTRQAGMLQHRVADLARDAALLPAVHEAGREIAAHHPEAVAPIIGRWIGDAVHYGQV